MQGAESANPLIGIALALLHSVHRLFSSVFKRAVEQLALDHFGGLAFENR